MIGMGFGFIIWILLMIIFFAILHWVIRSAINSSELNRTLKEIRDLLKAKKDGS
ncbi:MAG TPA: hypothetical protein VFK33_06755 [Bacillales bacterium]|nr:hypothetical protein [Bacillales bacterium]